MPPSLLIILVLLLLAAGLVVSIANSLVEFGVRMRKSKVPASLEAPAYELSDYFENNAFYTAAYDWIIKQQPEKVAIVSEDGLHLRGIYIENPGAKNAALVLPGWTDIKEYMFAEAKLMYDCGLHVLIPDQRAQGISEGEYSTFGFRESQDAAGWTRLLVEKGAERIVLYGRSMGAATAMLTACNSQIPQIACVIEDCGFTSMRDEMSSFVRSRVRWVPPFLYPLLTLVSNPIIRMRAGYNIDDAAPIDVLPSCKVPMLFIHGEQDDFVPYAMMADLYAAHPGPKEQLSVPGAKHARSLTTDSEQYVKTVQAFVKKYL